MKTEMNRLLTNKAAIQATGGIWEWVWLLVTGVFGLQAFVLGFWSRPSDPVPIVPVVFAACLVGCYAARNSRLNLEVVERLMELESRLERLGEGESGPHAPGDPAGRGAGQP